MKQSKRNSKKLGHYRPLEKCKMLKFTYGEICLGCNKCGRFSPIARRKSRARKKYGIDYRWMGKPIGFFSGKWERWKSYTTEKRRNQALKTLQGKDYCGLRFDFRKSQGLKRR